MSSVCVRIYIFNFSFSFSSSFSLGHMCVSEWMCLCLCSSNFSSPLAHNFFIWICVRVCASVLSIFCPQNFSMAIESGTYWKAQHLLLLSIFGRKSDFVRSITLSVANFIRTSEKTRKFLFGSLVWVCVCSSIHIRYPIHVSIICSFHTPSSSSLLRCVIWACMAHLCIVAVSQLNVKLNANNFVIIKSSPTSLRYCVRKICSSFVCVQNAYKNLL